MNEVAAPEGMEPNAVEYWDDSTLTYYERQVDNTIISRPYNESEMARYAKQRQLDLLGQAAKEAVPYLDERLVKCLDYMSLTSPSPEETAAIINNLCDLAAYSAGTLKRVIVVLGELTGRPV
ncbi:hypothetical protein SEA_SAFTANT_46 [Streptomyces phage Saftant]|uniref:Uncharacterized protein n=1 Tax=Streptomyces phage Saftant TaxID=2601693 RepID=A0A5J6D876_9CAUD|nr:hypothetical protein KGG95_gp46 [Streptomyces phage Saftant]QEQ94078.1 hypothetical protein SEA_SAFTANT_46 [Streptomyces phage Saftant]